MKIPRLRSKITAQMVFVCESADANSAIYIIRLVNISIRGAEIFESETWWRRVIEKKKQTISCNIHFHFLPAGFFSFSALGDTFDDATTSRVFVDNVKQGIFVRGSGALRVALLGADETAARALDKFANRSCVGESGAPVLLGGLSAEARDRLQVHIMPTYTENDHRPYLRALDVRAIIVLAAGRANLVLFNAESVSPKSFDKRLFEGAIKR